MSLAFRGEAASGHRATQIVRQLGATRLLATLFFLFVAVIVARFSWHLPLAVNAERALYDLRAVVDAPRVDQDPRIVMVVYTDETLAATAKRSPLDRTVLAKALSAIDGMGAKAIGIDVLIDQPQPEDGLLITAFQGMRTPTYLAYASTATNTANIQNWQQAFLDRFHRAIAGPMVHPASVFFLPDGDGAMRSWPRQPPSLPPLLSSAMTHNLASRGYERAVGYRLPTNAERAVFTRLPIDLFINPELAIAMRDQIAGRFVLIGGDIIDQDQFATPLTWYVNGTVIEDRPRNGEMIGLEVHAHMLAQLLDRRWFGALGRWATWSCALLVVVAGALTALSNARPLLVATLVVLQIAFFAGLPFAIQSWGIDTQTLPVFGWGVGWVLSFAAVGSAARAVGSEQRRFAQSALGRYLPRDIAAEILRNPDSLALQGEKREIFVIFTDLEGFTKLSHAIEPEMVAQLLNSYLDMLSDIVLRHGGTLDKFVGDAIVAFWGAPIARADDGERASRAALALYEAGETFRRNIPDGVPAIGHTRVGLHHGDAIVGNFGGEGRIQYTALGDSMNTASRLESANKLLASTVLASREAAELSGLDWYRPLGRVILRGRATPIDVMEPAPDMPVEDRRLLADLVERGRTGDLAARRELLAFARRHPSDAALANLAGRYQHLDERGCSVIG